MASVTVRMNTEARQQQIVQAALEAIGEYGIQGATISRIAKGAGITPAALYSHFENRRAILIAALDEVYGQITDSHRSSRSEDPRELFRLICERHTQKVLSQDKTSHAHLFLEFVASAPEEGLREVLREKELETKTYLASIVERFQTQGRIAKEVDAEMVAWLVACWAWTGDVANLMDATSIWHEKVSAHLMESILDVLTPASQTRVQSASASESLAHTPEMICPPDETPALNRSDCDQVPDGAVFTLEEAATILKISLDAISEMVSLNQIRSLSLGSQTRIARRALLAFLRGMSEEELDPLGGC